MKKRALFIDFISILLTLTLLFGIIGAQGESILPSVREIYSELPSVREALGRAPDEVITEEDGSLTERYAHFTEEDYQAFGTYLARENATLGAYTTENGILFAAIQTEAGSFRIEYHSTENEIHVSYPLGTLPRKASASQVEQLFEQIGSAAGHMDTAIPETTEGNPADTEGSGGKIPKDIKAGDIVSFGRYEQDGDTENGPEEIEWIVLERDEENHRALLISQYGLDAKQYNEENIDITWENCTLRAWLNNEFLNMAFTEHEQQAILMTDVDNSSSQGYSGYNTSGGNDTQDRIFLLSYSEANRYFGVEHYEVSGSNQNIKARIAPTTYALQQGAVTDYNTTKAGTKAGKWWLRSPGYFQYCAAYVHTGGSLVNRNVIFSTGCVRPALWINLESDILSGENTATSETTEEGQTDAENPGRKNQKGINVGDIVSFGRYEQDGDTDNGPEEIEWIVLDYDEENCRALLISQYGLDTKQYNKENIDITWENCTLRAWLNNEFLNTAFTEQEQEGIMLTNVDNSESQGYSRWKPSGGNDTQDRIFLLSYAEANRYFGGVEYWQLSGSDQNVKARVAPTAYVLQQGVYTNDKTTEAGAKAGWWWLRSPGINQDCAANIYTDGSLNCDVVNYSSGCIRPALWIDLESDIF